MPRNYYVALGVHRQASQTRIDVMYQGQMRDWEGAGVPQQTLRDAQQAYSVVGHPLRRLAYDQSMGPRLLSESPKEAGSSNPPAEPLIPPRQPADLGDVSLARSFRTFAPSAGEIFERLWSNFTGEPRPKGEMLESLSIQVPITPEQALTGGTARILVPALVQCHVCQGHGGVGGFLCWQCEGRGHTAVEEAVHVSFPAGFSQYTVQVPLDHLGIHNFYLAVHFRMTQAAIE
jgi:DnaJ-class molecular chaperone